MDKYLSAIQKILDTVSSNPKFSRQLKFDRVEYRKAAGAFRVYFNTTTHLHPVDYLKLLQKTKQEFETDGIIIVLSQKEFASELEADNAMMENFVRDFLVYKKQSFLPFAANLSLKVQKGKISLAFRDDFALGLYEKSGFGSQIKDFFSKTYMLDYSVAATFDENGSEETQREYKPLFDVQREMHKNGQKKRELPLVQPIQPDPPSEKKQRAVRTRKVAEIKGDPLPISDLMPGMDCIIQGRIVYIESISLREGQYMKYRFGVYDKTGTVGCWFIESAGTKNRPSEIIKKGETVKISGSYYYEKYERDNAVAVAGVCGVKLPERTDSAPQKELSCTCTRP